MPFFSSTTENSSQTTTSTKANDTQSMTSASSTYSSNPLLKETKTKSKVSEKESERSSMGSRPLVHISWQSWLAESTSWSWEGFGGIGVCEDKIQWFSMIKQCEDRRWGWKEFERSMRIYNFNCWSNVEELLRNKFLFRLLSHFPALFSSS
jgi:hypothetical protein